VKACVRGRFRNIVFDLYVGLLFSLYDLFGDGCRFLCAFRGRLSLDHHYVGIFTICLVLLATLCLRGGLVAVVASVFFALRTAVSW
jgi:hypothetical protein